MRKTCPHQLGAIIYEAARAYRIAAEDITSDRRDAITCAARADAIYHARRAGYSLNFLAHFLRRDHTTILYAEKRHAAKISRIAQERKTA